MAQVAQAINPACTGAAVGPAERPGPPGDVHQAATLAAVNGWQDIVCPRRPLHRPSQVMQFGNVSDPKEKQANAQLAPGPVPIFCSKPDNIST